ncbi:MAG: GDP-L-fucose synthase family protein [Flavobacteriaceae bacterium]
MKVFVTGGSGMVGRNLVEYLIGKEVEVLYPTSKQINLLDKEALSTFIKKNDPEMIIHCAGLVGGIQANIDNPARFLYENTQIGLNVIISSYETGIKRFINMGSSCMYPRNAKNPLVEELVLKGELEPTNEGYAIAKITSSKLCEYINKEDSSFQYKTIIPCNLYGRYDKFDPKHSHMIPAVIKKIHDAKISKKKNIDIWGDGQARREFMYTEDLANFIYHATERFDKMPQNINVGLGHDYSINQYYRIIADVIGYKGKFQHDFSKPVGMKQKLIDDSKLQQFGWKHKTSLKDGIEKTYDYFLKEVLNDK